MKTPDFLICENEQSNLDGEYVLHTKTPRFLAQIIHDQPKNKYKIIDDIDGMLAFFNNDQTKVDKLLRKMDDWFVSYQKYLDNQYGEDE